MSDIGSRDVPSVAEVLDFLRILDQSEYGSERSVFSPLYRRAIELIEHGQRDRTLLAECAVALGWYSDGTRHDLFVSITAALATSERTE